MNYKSFLPFDEYELHTSLTCTEVRDTIAGILEPARKAPLFSLKTRNTKPYSGRLTYEGFEISRNIDYRNSFLPQIRGRILPATKGTILHIRMRPHLFVLIFMSFWLGVVGLVCLGILFSLLTEWGQIGREGLSLPTLIPFGMFAAGYGLLIGAYRAESKKSKAFLAALLTPDRFRITD